MGTHVIQTAYPLEARKSAMVGRYLIIMSMSAILFYPFFVFNAYALNVCTEGSSEDGLTVYAQDFKDVPENNFINCTYIAQNGDVVYFVPLYIKSQKPPISFFIPYNARRFEIRTWENYSALTGEMGNMIEESGWIDKSKEGWPKKCVREIPVF